MCHIRLAFLQLRTGRVAIAAASNAQPMDGGGELPACCGALVMLFVNTFVSDKTAQQ
jgi:hypothetical protein